MNNLEISVLTTQIDYYKPGPIRYYFKGNRAFINALITLRDEIQKRREAEIKSKTSLNEEIKKTKESKEAKEDKNEGREAKEDKKESKEVKEDKEEKSAPAAIVTWKTGELDDAEMKKLKGIIDTYKEEYIKENDSESGRIYYSLAPTVNAIMAAKSALLDAANQQTTSANSGGKNRPHLPTRLSV